MSNDARSTPNKQKNPQIQPEDGLSATGAAEGAALASTPVAEQRCGRIGIVGRPNVGKSTLLNALVGQKISITSRKAQTTRHRITGIRTRADTQFVFVDTPGFQSVHRSALNRSLNRAVTGVVADVDLLLWVVEAGRFTPADERVQALIGDQVPVILVANKLDLAGARAGLAPWLQQMQARRPLLDLFPMSAKQARDIDRLLDLVREHLPHQAWWHAEDELTDRSERFLAAEIVREKLFRLTGDELPYSSAVTIDTFSEEPAKRGGRMVRIAASIVVDREGHKPMVIGDQGERIKRIGTEARVELERLLDAKVFIEIWVKVRSGWADDEQRLRAFGYE